MSPHSAHRHRWRITAEVLRTVIGAVLLAVGFIALCWVGEMGAIP
jgi:hypothetical protein